MEKINKNKVFVFLDVSVDGDPLERMIFELFTDVAPNTAENFRALCTGEKGVSPKTGKPLHYKGTFFHSIVKGQAAEAGDFLRRNGEYGESIYGGKFPDESPNLSHDAAGLLSMAIADRDEKGSLFIVTFEADHRLDRKSVVFGKLVDGYQVLKKIEDAGDDKGNPVVTVKIVNSGELHDYKKESSKKMGKHVIEENNHSVKRKGKHKKSSRKKRKRRRHYVSESDSSSDTDTDSSESDTDSESDASSLSDTSSSRDDRRKRRKRSKRDRHRRARKKDRQREKRRRRRDKKKKKSKRDNGSGESDDNSGSSSQDVAVVASDGKYKHADNQSPLVEQENKKVSHKKGNASNKPENEGEFTRENGKHHNNSKGLGMKFDRSANRHPEIVDGRASKSRSGSLNPRRTKSRSMSISPRPATQRSPGDAPKHNRSQGPSVSPSPQPISRSRNITPAKSESSRSPVRNTRERSASMNPPYRSLSPRSHSRSATYSPRIRRVSRSPPRASPQRLSLSRSLGKPSRGSVSRSPIRSPRKGISRSSGRAPPRRSMSPSPSPSPVRGPRRAYRPSRSGSPVSVGRRARSPISDRSRSPSVDGSPRRIRRGRGYSDRYAYARRYRSRSRSPDRSPVRSYRYGGRGNRDRYSSYRRSPRRYRSPPRGRTPPRYRGSRRSRTRSLSPSRSPVRYRGRRHSRSASPGLVKSRSPVERNRSSQRAPRRRSPSWSPIRSRSGSPVASPQSARGLTNKSRSRSPSYDSPPSRNRPNLVSYGGGSPDSGPH